MAALTLTQLFGASATLSAGTLTINTADFSAVGLSGASPEPADLAAALLLHWKANAPTDATNDPTVGVVVGDSFKAFTTRGTTQQIEYQYPVSLYVPDTTTSLDPDSVVGA